MGVVYFVKRTLYWSTSRPFLEKHLCKLKILSDQTVSKKHFKCFWYKIDRNQDVYLFVAILSVRVLKLTINETSLWAFFFWLKFCTTQGVKLLAESYGRELRRIGSGLVPLLIKWKRIRGYWLLRIGFRFLWLRYLRLVKMLINWLVGRSKLRLLNIFLGFIFLYCSFIEVKDSHLFRSNKTWEYLFQKKL